MTTTLPTTSPALTAVRALSPYELASRADVASPDHLTSPGAAYLASIRDALAEALEHEATTHGTSLADAIRDGAASDAADGAALVYTADIWATFVDLAAYAVDTTDYGPAPEDMTAAASLALHALAQRLVSALVGDLEDEE